MKGKPQIFFDRILKEGVCFIGTRQTGKTNALVAMMNSIDVPYIAFDTIGVIARALKRGWRPVNPKTQKIFTPPRNPASIRASFDKVCNDVLLKKNMLLIIDEIAACEYQQVKVRGVMKSVEVPYFCSKQWLHPLLSQIQNLEGNNNIAVWFTSQRVAQVHNSLLAACKYHFIFGLYLPSDVAWYAEVIGKSDALRASNLKPYEFLFKKIGGSCDLMEKFDKMY